MNRLRTRDKSVGPSSFTTATGINGSRNAVIGGRLAQGSLVFVGPIDLALGSETSGPPTRAPAAKPLGSTDCSVVAGPLRSELERLADDHLDAGAFRGIGTIEPDDEALGHRPQAQTDIPLHAAVKFC